MIKSNIDITNGQFALEHDVFCKEHVVDEITKLLDLIIIDNEIKTVPSKNDLTLEEKKELLLTKRKEYLELMEKQECDYSEYFSNPFTYIVRDEET